LYITAGLQCTTDEDEENEQKTDLHFRSRGGLGSFNWRMKFPITLPKRKFMHYPRLKLQIWDMDFWTANDFCGEAIIPLAGFLRFCELHGSLAHNVKKARSAADEDEGKTKTKDSYTRVKMVDVTKKEEKEREKIWIDLDELDARTKLAKMADCTWAIPDFVKDDPNEGKKGKILISIELLSEKYAKLLPAGLGREKPNKNPILPDPEGRQEFSVFHPCDALRRILGDELCTKISCLCCWVFLFVFIVMISPDVMSNILANMVTE